MSAELSERDELTLRLVAVAVADEMSYAAARRAALSERAAQLRAEEPWIAEAVEAAIRYRKRQTNVLQLRRTAR